MISYCGTVRKITAITSLGVYILLGSADYKWKEWMFQEFKHGDIFHIKYHTGPEEFGIAGKIEENQKINCFISIFKATMLQWNALIKDYKIPMENIKSITYCSERDKIVFLIELREKGYLWDESNKTLRDIKIKNE